MIESRPPQLRIEVPENTKLAVLGRDGQAFIHMSPTGTYGRGDSSEYQASQRAMGLPPKDGRGWIPMPGAGPTTVVWADFRLDYQAKLPASGADKAMVLDEWRIPVIVHGRPDVIRGRSVWEPMPLPEIASGEQPGTLWDAGSATTYLVAGGLMLVLIGTIALARPRRREEPRSRKAALMADPRVSGVEVDGY